MIIFSNANKLISKNLNFINNELIYVKGITSKEINSKNKLKKMNLQFTHTYMYVCMYIYRHTLNHNIKNHTIETPFNP